MKRFYKEVVIEPLKDDGGYALFLDSREVKTPGKATFIAPTRPLADLIASEWREQGDEIRPEGMHMNRLLNTTIDRVEPRREAIIGEVVQYAGTDLICYKAEEPAELVILQDKVWDSYIEWINQLLNVHFKVTSGIIHIQQEETTLAAVRAYISAYNPYELTALYILTTGMGSFILALAFIEEYQDFENVWKASQIDQDFQIEKWGEDHEAAQSRTELKQEMDFAVQFHKLASE